MTSLYDKFHSKQNTDHVYKLLDDLVKRQTGQTINNDIENTNYYQNSLREIFIKSEKDTLEELNREVLTYNLRYFLDKYKKNQIEPVKTREPDIPTKPEEPESTNVMDDYNKFLESRKTDVISEKPRETLLQPNIEPRETFLQPTILETIEEKLEYELEVNILTIENVLKHMYNYYMIHKTDIDKLYDTMIRDGYSFIKIPRDMKDELINELNIRVEDNEPQTGS